MLLAIILYKMVFAPIINRVLENLGVIKGYIFHTLREEVFLKKQEVAISWIKALSGTLENTIKCFILALLLVFTLQAISYYKLYEEIASLKGTSIKRKKTLTRKKKR